MRAEARRPFGAVAVLASLLAAAGCEQRRFDAAVAADTQEAYLGYLARYDGGRHGAEARLRIEALRWKAASGSASIYALRRYLADYPDGRFVVDARRRLAEIRLDRARAARDPEALRRLLDTSPEASVAREARATLEQLELERVLRRGDSASLRAFVEEFPTGTASAAARAALRARDLEAAGDDAAALERLVQSSPGTPEAATATRRLAAIAARRVRAAGEAAPAMLELLRLRHPDHPELAALQELAARMELRCASAWLDREGTERWLERYPGHAEAAAARARLRDLRRRAALVSRVRALLDAALPYRASAPLDELRGRALGGELEASRLAVAELQYAPEPEAAALLVDIATGPQIVVAADAVDTLLALCRRRGAAACTDLLATAHVARPGEPPGLRRALLRLAAGDERGALASLVDVTVAGEQPGRARVLPTVLLARLRLRLGPAEPAREAIERVAADVAAHLAALERLFPVDLDRERAPEALLAARTAAALLRLVDSLPAPSLAPLRSRLGTRVREWEQQLRAVVPGFVPSAADPVAAAVRTHERQRAAALADLEALARKEPLARVAAEQAKLGNAGLRVCPGAPRGSGVGHGSRATP